MGKSDKKVYYVCFYADPDVAEKVSSWPSVWSKIDYITDSMKRAGWSVVVLSAVRSRKRRFSGGRKTIDHLEEHVYLSSRKYRINLLDRIDMFFHWLKLIAFLLLNVKKDDRVVVYHSLYHRFWLRLYSKVFKKRFVLEIEDIFSEIDPKLSRFQKSEWKMIARADAWLCVNDLIKERINASGKKVLSYGSYSLPKWYGRKNEEDIIKLVYAGVIEKNRNAAFLAVDAMNYLDDKYELHILGFGNENCIEELYERINQINRDRNKTRAFYHGMLTGEEYYRFLQNCHVGLSTHAYDRTNMVSAEYTFPSKILVYLSNGLRVVAQGLTCLKESEVGDLIDYYEEPTGKSLAQAIGEIDISRYYDSRAVIRELDAKFVQEISAVLEN